MCATFFQTNLTRFRVRIIFGFNQAIDEEVANQLFDSAVWNRKTVATNRTLDFIAW
jgi:hypothetical protein